MGKIDSRQRDVTGSVEFAKQRVIRRIIPIGYVGLQHHHIFIAYSMNDPRIVQDKSFEIVTIGAPGGGEINQHRFPRFNRRGASGIAVDRPRKRLFRQSAGGVKRRRNDQNRKRCCHQRAGIRADICTVRMTRNNAAAATMANSDHQKKSSDSRCR